MSSLRSATQSCPADEELAAFVEGRLARSELRRVGEHLRACDACCEIVERYASAWQLDAPRIATEPSLDGTDHEPALAPGRSFARYVLLHLVGRGGMADVHAAYDPVLDRRVALKLLHPSEGRDVRARMLHEARTVAALAHPHVVAIYDVGQAHGRDYIAMELVEGGSLARWLAAGPHDDAAILDVFRQAGLGLAAAHARGIVHRDFKPANALVGLDGRVRVADFGLALQRGTAATRAGTRGYVAPEQARGAPPDPLADQYSFCVALQEALGGAPATSESETQSSPRSGSRSDAPTLARAGRPIRTRRIAAAIARGLDPDPARRFASMTELLAALAPGRARPLALAAAAAVAAIALVPIGLGARERACASGDALRDELWTAADLERARAAFDATALPYADAAWTRTRRELDARADAWIERAHAACVAGDVERECLDRARAELQQTLAVLADADTTTVTNAAALVDALADDACDEPAGEAIAVDPLAHASLVGELANARALRLAGHDASARIELERVVDGARAAGDDVLRRDAAIELAAILSRSGDATAAVVLADVAYESLAAGDDASALRALTALVLTDGAHRADRATALRWERDAKAVLERMGSPARERARLERARGGMYLSMGDHAQAVEALRSVLAHAQESHGTDHLETAQAQRDLGLALFMSDALPEAHERVEASLAIRRHHLGEDHPDVAESLDLLFAIARGRGEHARAVELARQAVSIYERANGTDHLATINARMHLGMALEDFDLPAARDHIAAAVEALQRLVGPHHPHVASAHFNLAQFDLRLDRFEDALANAHTAYAVSQSLYGDEHLEVIAATLAIGSALLRLGRLDEARPWVEDAHRRSGDAPPARRAFANDSLARLEYEAGNFARAAELYEAGAADWATAYGPDHPEARTSRSDAAETRAMLKARSR
jgi:tetratricopeptide (TPR) repeat protein/tRNA A-37 threonylcarbamoyl transferase component Bud32